MIILDAAMMTTLVLILTKLFFMEHSFRQFKKDYYRGRILRFAEKLENNPDWKPRKERYESTFRDYDKYIDLGGNSYIQVTVMPDVFESYNDKYGGQNE